MLDIYKVTENAALKWVVSTPGQTLNTFIVKRLLKSGSSGGLTWLKNSLKVLNSFALSGSFRQKKIYIVITGLLF